MIPGKLPIDHGLPIPPVAANLREAAVPVPERLRDEDYEAMWGVPIEEMKFNFIVMPRGGSVLIPKLSVSAPRLNTKVRIEIARNRSQLTQRQSPEGLRVWRIN